MGLLLLQQEELLWKQSLQSFRLVWVPLLWPLSPDGRAQSMQEQASRLYPSVLCPEQSWL